MVPHTNHINESSLTNKFFLAPMHAHSYDQPCQQIPVSWINCEEEKKKISSRYYMQFMFCYTFYYFTGKALYDEDIKLYWGLLFYNYLNSQL